MALLALERFEQRGLFTADVGAEAVVAMQLEAEIAAGDDDFETLVAAATAANLIATLGDPDSNLTLFAPTDAAFEAMGAPAVQYLLDNPGKLESTLLYHVAGAELSSVDAIAATGAGITMANG
ncbi:MAG: fasciclin domain-containing protein, partial [Curvibacter sp.]